MQAELNSIIMKIRKIQKKVDEETSGELYDICATLEWLIKELD